MAPFPPPQWGVEQHQQQQQQQQQQANSSNISYISSSNNHSHRPLSSGWPRDTDYDPELSVRLKEIAASGKAVTEDVIVDCQLSQFPVYGTAAAARSAATFNFENEDEFDAEDYSSNNNNDEAGHYDKNGSLKIRQHQRQASAEAPHSSTHGWLSSWGLPALLGGTAAGGDTTPLFASNSEHAESHVDTPTTTGANAKATSASTSALVSDSEDMDWDPSEKFLWKKQQSPVLDNVTNQCVGQERSDPSVSRVREHRQTLLAKYDYKEESKGYYPLDKHAGIATQIGTPLLTASLTAGPLFASQLPQFPRSPNNNPSPSLQLANRQHWMPDQLCRHCYACESAFTVFRRRHHCRFCGQVFCNSCSANFVSSTNARSSRSSSSGVGESPDVTATTIPSTYASNNSSSKKQQQQQSDPQATLTKVKVRVCQMCHDHAERQEGELSSSLINDLQPVAVEMKRPLNNKADSNWGVQRDDNTHTQQNVHPLVIKISEQSNHITSPSVKEQILRLASDATNSSLENRTDFPSSGNVTEGSMHIRGDVGRRQLPQQQQQIGQRTGDSENRVAVVGANSIEDGARHLKNAATKHLEGMAKELIRQYAPLIWKSSNANLDDVEGPEERFSSSPGVKKGPTIDEWVQTLDALAARCCSTVNPNVKKGDFLDIRPYVKIKVIPGGNVDDCSYLSGVMFRKTVSHKRMVREVDNPRIMLLSGGIEFTRTENWIASLETLFEQEDRYMEILVGKILQYQPDLLFVGRSVSRKAQELLLKAGVILMQHVKPNLLSRISRQTGATVISSTDHIMNQFGANVLGNCRRFRLVAFRDNEAWSDIESDDTTKLPSELSNDSVDKGSTKKRAHVSSLPDRKRSIPTLLSDPGMSSNERHNALAAKRLGEGVLDGCDAVKAGLAKRGVAHTYTMLEGCPKRLGCTVVLRGANRASLKQLKGVFRFLAISAYNLRLETTYLIERGARLIPDFKVLSQHALSSSLGVDYGKPAEGRKVRPWNGGNIDSNIPRLESGELSALDFQSILITSVWMTEKTQCCPAEVKGICYYSLQDVALGQFLRDSCFNLSLKCQNPNCKKSVLDHSLSFVHNDGLINIMVEEMDDALLKPGSISRDEIDTRVEDEYETADQPIATWTFCQRCQKIVTPLTYISDLTWKFSFGKFLEVFFYNHYACLNAPGHNCSCNLQRSATLYFGCDKLAARFTYERIAPFGVFVRRSLPLDIIFHRNEAMRRLDLISVESSNLFVNFDKQIEMISREARSLFNSAMNRPEHLQTVLSELNRIGSEVDHTAKILQEKVASVSENCRLNVDGSVNGALFRFPLFARRYLFNLSTAWNEKLSAAGQVISAMKKIAASSSQLQDGTMGPNVTASIGDPLNEELSEGMKRLRQLIEDYASYNVTDITQVLPTLPRGGEIQHDGDFDEDFDEPDVSIDFADGIDADVLASRRRLKSSKHGQASFDRPRIDGEKPTKTLGTRRAISDAGRSSGIQDSNSLPNVPPRPTPGGAVKSAITRFFNRGGRDNDQYVVDLGKFADGRPRLAPGVNGIVVPVIDDQLSTIIAYSLASLEYSKQFKHFLKDGGGVRVDSDEVSDTNSTSQRIWPKPDLDAGVGNDDGPSSANESSQNPASQKTQSAALPEGFDDTKSIERQMLNRNKSHIKHTFRDVDEKGQVSCKFVCTTYWATQFHAVRQVFLSVNGGKNDHIDSALQGSQDVEQSYIESLLSAFSWAASGGKSGASFARTADDRFVIKCISRTELQMFLDCARAYFEYLCKAFFHGLPTVLCKIVGVYQIGVHNRETGKRSMEQVAVMQNIFYNKKITKIFDLKGSLRGRFAAHAQNSKDDRNVNTTERRSDNNLQDDGVSRHSNTNSLVDDNAENNRHRLHGPPSSAGPSTLLDGDFLEFTLGRPMPLTDRAKAVFQMSILNDTLFLSIINVLDYSILVGFDEEKMELVVGIIDFMRQYDILKQMERVGKSLPMVVGSEAPTIIQPPLYKARFTNAMERYFMTVPSKWTTI